MLDPRKFDEYKRFFAEFNVLVKGELDAEYKRVKDAIAKLDAQHGTLAELRQQQKEVEQTAAELEAEHAHKEAHFQSVAAELEQRGKELADKLSAHAKASTDLTAAAAAHSSWADSERAAIDQIRRELADKERSLFQLETAIRNREVDVAEKEKKIKNAMAILNPVKA